MPITNIIFVDESDWDRIDKLTSVIGNKICAGRSLMFAAQYNYGSERPNVRIVFATHYSDLSSGEELFSKVKNFCSSTSNSVEEVTADTISDYVSGKRPLPKLGSYVQPKYTL